MWIILISRRKHKHWQINAMRESTLANLTWFLAPSSPPLEIKTGYNLLLLLFLPQFVALDDANPSAYQTLRRTREAPRFAPIWHWHWLRPGIERERNRERERGEHCLLMLLNIDKCFRFAYLVKATAQRIASSATSVNASAVFYFSGLFWLFCGFVYTRI